MEHGPLLQSLQNLLPRNRDLYKTSERSDNTWQMQMGSSYSAKPGHRDLC